MGELNPESCVQYLEKDLIDIISCSHYVSYFTLPNTTTMILE